MINQIWDVATPVKIQHDTACHIASLDDRTINGPYTLRVKFIHVVPTADNRFIMKRHHGLCIVEVRRHS
jgi:hypothetical protein